MKTNVAQSGQDAGVRRFFLVYGLCRRYVWPCLTYRPSGGYLGPLGRLKDRLGLHCTSEHVTYIKVTGLGVLFEKLQQGARENRQVLTIARMRAEAEDAYSSRLADIVPNADKISGGFSRDDGATIRKVRVPALHPMRFVSVLSE